MYICHDCKSHNIIDTEDYSVWFRENNMLKNRVVMVYRNLNTLDNPLGWISFCTELSYVVCGNGKTQREAILDLGNKLRDLKISDMVGKNLDE